MAYSLVLTPEGIQGGNLEAVIEVETIDEGCLLARSSTSLTVHLPRDDTTHSGLGLHQ